MGVVLMLVLPLPIGWFVRSRLMAHVAHLAAFSLLFTLQSTLLIVEWAGGSEKAFGGFPKGGTDEVWSYDLVNLALLAVGIGLVSLAATVAGRRRSRRGIAVPVAGQPA